MNGMSKGKQKYTIMIIPHSDKHTVTFNIPVYIFQALAVMLILATILFFVGMKAYITMKKDNTQLQSARLELEAVKSKLNEMAYRVEDMESSVMELENLETEIREKTGFSPTEKFFTGKEKRVILASRSSGGIFQPSASTMVINNTEETLERLQEAVPSRTESAKELIVAVEEKNKRLAHTPSIYPTIGRITSRFGYRNDPFNGHFSFHDGIDFANHYNTPIYATAEGKVVQSQRMSGYGNQVRIYHGYGVSTSYSHLSKMAVSAGDLVKKGQVIGYMGSTGRSTGSHLHYMVYINGEPVNPVKYLPR